MIRDKAMLQEQQQQECLVYMDRQCPSFCPPYGHGISNRIAASSRLPHLGTAS